MSRFGWAYANSLVTGAVANGPTNSIQFNSGSQVLSGSSNFTFDPATNEVTLLGELTGSTLVISASVVSASTYLGITGGSTSPGDGDKSIQFNSGSTFSGSTNLTFDYTTNTLYLTGTLRADNLIVSSSQILKSGSTIFGDDITDTHQFTGSILGGIVSGTIARFVAITGSDVTASTLDVSGISVLGGQVRAFGGIEARNSNISVTNLVGGVTLATMTTAGLVSGTTGQFSVVTASTFTGSTALFTDITGNLFGTASYSTLAATASYYNTSSLIITASATNATITFTKGDGTTFPLTVDNVTNAQTASYVLNAVSASYASNADLLDGRDSTTFAGTGSNTFNGNQIITGTLNVSSTVSGTTAQFTTVSSSYISASEIANINFIDFHTSSVANPSYNPSRLFYDINTGDLSYYLPTVTNQQLQIGQQTIVKVKNSTGSPIAKGKLVHITGGVGNNPLINTASWENDNNSANTLGMLMSTVAHNDFGYVLLNGVITDVNTDPATFTAGQVVYLSSSGDYTATTPVAPKHSVRIGEVIRAHATVGAIFIKIDNGYEIDELHNVLITSASTGDLLSYNSSSAIWENSKSLSGSYTITGSLTATNSISASTGQFTSLTASSISANSVPAFGPNQAIQYNNAGILNGASNLTFDGTQVRITGSIQVVSGTTIVAEVLSTGVRTTGKPVQVRNASSVIVGVMDETGLVSGSIGRFGTITGSAITSSSEILVANNATIGGNILGSGAIKGNYSTYTGSFTIPSTSYFVGISTTGSVVTASLNSATSYPAGQTMYFKDVGGNAGTNNIRIQPSGSQTIDGATSLIISNTSGSATIVSNGVDTFYIVGLT